MFNKEKTLKELPILSSLSYWALLLLAVVLPVFVLPGTGIQILMVKVFVGGALVFLALALFSIGHMRLQEITIPRSLALGAVWLLPVAYMLSSLFSPGSGQFFGERLLMESTGFMFIIAIAVTVTAITLNTSRRALGMYLALLASASLLILSEAYIFFQRYLTIKNGTFEPGGQLFSLVGSANDLGVFFGLIAIFVLLSLALLPLTNAVRGGLWVVLVAAAYFLAVVNLTALWWVIGAFSLGFFVHSMTVMYFSKNEEKTKALSVASLAFLLLATLFIAVPASDGDGNIQITGVPANSIQYGEFDVRPSWATTVALGSQAYAEEGALFGPGPGSFYHVWTKHLPSSINVSSFWLTDFFYGIGFVPTSIISTGLLGAIAWLMFFGIFLWKGTKHLVMLSEIKRGDIVGFIRVTSFVSALYLWITAVIMVPSAVLIIFASILTGVFIASIGYSGESKYALRFVFKEKPHVGFIATLVLTVAFLGSIGGVYGLYSKYSAESLFQKAVVAVASEGDIEKAYVYVSDAIEKSKLDVYYRFKSNLDAMRIQALMQENRAPEEVREEFEKHLQRAIASGLEATKLDKRDYQNWANLGNVYQSIAPLGVEGSVASAIAQYDNALKFRPSSPTIYYAKALLERGRGDNEKALEYVRQAITLRNQYTQAIFLLAQIQIEQGDAENAINSVEAITLFEPQNAVAHFQLGLLYYSQDDFVSAARSFERALRITPDYANARYFVGLAYWKLGNRELALESFNIVFETNPENAEVERIISNMEAGNEPFAHLEETPNIEDRIGLPIEDANDGASFDPNNRFDPRFREFLE